jgi:membrane associated rhomboid family serine protease
MYVPLHDDAPLRVIRFQAVTALIIAANLAIFLYTRYVAGAGGETEIALALGATPAVITDRVSLDPELQWVPDLATLLTYMFLHAGWLHLIANMAFMWVFADNVEDAYGHAGFFVFYLVTGVLAGLAHILTQPGSTAPLIGASGAVAGVMAGYLVLFPHARIWILLFMRLPLRISATWAVLGWLAFQFVALFAERGEEEVAVAWWAHIGGFAAGLVITWTFRDRLRERLTA